MDDKRYTNSVILIKSYLAAALVGIAFLGLNQVEAEGWLRTLVNWSPFPAAVLAFCIALWLQGGVR